MGRRFATVSPREGGGGASAAAGPAGYADTTLVSYTFRLVLIFPIFIIRRTFYMHDYVSFTTATTVTCFVWLAIFQRVGGNLTYFPPIRVLGWGFNYYLVSMAMFPN
jgi:hypothetical protein